MEPNLHALTKVGTDGCQTACAGAWRSDDSPAEVFMGARVPTQWPRCNACCELVGVIAERPKYVAPPGVLIEFDMGELE